MKKIFGIIILILFSLTLNSCGKDDSSLSDHIFNEYETELESAGYNLVKVDATNNVSGWLDITDEDVVSIYRTTSEENEGILYMYRFSTINKAEKWYDKISDNVVDTNYKALLDGHYVIVVLGDALYGIAEAISK